MKFSELKIGEEFKYRGTSLTIYTKISETLIEYSPRVAFKPTESCDTEVTQINKKACSNCKNLCPEKINLGGGFINNVFHCDVLGDDICEFIDIDTFYCSEFQRKEG